MLEIEFRRPDEEREGDTLVESCDYKWKLVSPDGTQTGSATSSITYRVQDQGTNTHLTAVAVTQDITIGPFQLEWSWASRFAVWVNLETGYEYTVIRRPLLRPSTLIVALAMLVLLLTIVTAVALWRRSSKYEG